MPDASKLIELLATEPRFVAALSLLRTKMGVKGTMQSVVERAKEEMSSRKEKTVGSRLYKVLTTVRNFFPKWADIKDFLTLREGVPNAESGCSSRNGSNPKWQGLTVDGKLVLKARPRANCTVEQVLAQLAASTTHDVSEEQAEWRKQLASQGGVVSARQRQDIELLVSQLQKLESVEEVVARSMAEYKDTRLIDKDAHATLLAFPFALGVQDKLEATEYQQHLGEAAHAATLVQEALMGSAQRSFASELLCAEQLRGTAWTTATAISRSAPDTAAGAASVAAQEKRRAEQEKLLEKFEVLLSQTGQIGMGFAAGDEGVQQIERFRERCKRFMNPHGDTEDYCDVDEFWDGLACLLSCSAGGSPGRNGDLLLLGKSLASPSGAASDAAAQCAPPAERAAAEPKKGRKRVSTLAAKVTESVHSLAAKVRESVRGRSPLDFMQAVWAELNEKSKQLFAVIKVPARPEGTMAIARTRNQLHGANVSEGVATARHPGGRQVVILYKTGAVARILVALGKALPMLNDGGYCRCLVLSVLQMFVLASTGVETFQLRTEGRWKQTDSKHEGDKVYRKYDAQCDVALFNYSDELKAVLARMRTKAAACEDPSDMMASVVEDMLLDVAHESILRPVARLMIEMTRGGDKCITRSEFDKLISERVWTMRVGHAYTHMDAKCSRSLAFAEALRKEARTEGFTREEELIMYMQWAHAAYPVASRYREHISEDPERVGLKPKLSVWLRKDESKEKRSIVVTMAKASENQQAEADGNSMALQRHGISGCGFTTKEGSLKPSIAGRKDGSGEEHSLLATLGNAGAKLLSKLYEPLPAWKSKGKGKGKATATGATKGQPLPAREFLKKVMQHKDVSGGGGLITQRVMALSEPTGLLGDVLEAYMPGGDGSHKALVFVATLLGIEPTEIDVQAVLTALKRRLEVRDARGDTRLAARLRALSKEHEVLRDHEDLCALLGSTLLTGGTLETTLCDVIWRLYRPLRLGCEKPRKKQWREQASGVQHGGKPLDRVPIFSAGGVVTVYDVHAYFVAWAAWRDGARGASSAKPKVESFVRE
jgi:hypothetical protein